MKRQTTDRQTEQSRQMIPCMRREEPERTTVRYLASKTSRQADVLKMLNSHHH
jgi:hypothetical protein